jgi:carbamoyl-phosphate synthase large subunit
MAGTKPDGGLRRTGAPARRGGFTIEEIFGLNKIDRWFLVQIKEIVDFEEELATAKN